MKNDGSAERPAPRRHVKETRGAVLVFCSVLALVTCDGSPTAAPASVRAPAVRVATTLEVDPPIDGIAVGDTVQLNAVLKDQYGRPMSGYTAGWQSSDTTIASVSSTGLVTGRGAGPVRITATVSDKTAAALLTVRPPPRVVTTVAIEPANISLAVGDTTQLRVVVKDQDGNPLDGYEATWQSSDATVAAVSSPGIVTGVAAGAAVITATVSGRSAVAQLTVRSTAPPVVTSVVVEPATAEVEIGETVQLTATVTDENGATVRGHATTWQSSDTTIAAVSTSGLVTGTGEGAAIITVSVSGRSAAAQLTVRKPVVPVVTTVAVDPAVLSVGVGDTAQLSAIVQDQKGRPMSGQPTTWQSSDSTVASVSSSGLVTARAVGSATITATVADRSAVAQLTVSAQSRPIATTVVVEAPVAAVGAGQSVQLRAVVKDQNGRTLNAQPARWQSSDTTVAFVSASGLLTGIGAGIATVTATVADKSGTKSLTIAPAPANPAAPPVAIGIWISKTELDALPLNTASWQGTGEVKHTADAAWMLQPIERQGGQAFNVQAMAGALVFARLYPDPSAEAYRARVVRAIRVVMALPRVGSATVTAPNRFLGTWAITADLINLPAYDPVLNAQFRAWLQYKLTERYKSEKSVRQQMGHANNQGSWACFSLAAASVYLGDRATLDLVATRTRRWLGDTSVPFKLKWTDKQSWQMNPADSATWVGINPKGATRNGYNFDGLQPSDQNRGAPMDYDSTDFPNSFSAVRYNETSLHGAIGAVLVLHRAGYTDLVDASDQALLRAARWIKYAADNFAADGYQYFTGPHEAVRPLINYLYPSANLPGSRARPQATGRAYGYAWTYWTHEGRSLRR